MSSPERPSGADAGNAPGSEIPWLDPALQRLDGWSERVSFELFRFGLYVTMPALVVLVSLDVTLRYVFNAPLQWARDVNGLLLLITIFTALPHAWDRTYHIRMEVFYSRFSERKQRVADVLSSLAGVIFFGMMAVQGARFVPFMIRTGETGEDLELPLWPFMAVLSFCSFVVVARVLSNPRGEEKFLRYPSVAGGGGGTGEPEGAPDGPGAGPRGDGPEDGWARASDDEPDGSRERGSDADDEGSVR
ncbi:MAG: TRAP transporter small permease [Gemmatimonadota bacterium]